MDEEAHDEKNRLGKLSVDPAVAVNVLRSSVSASTLTYAATRGHSHFHPGQTDGLAHVGADNAAHGGADDDSSGCVSNSQRLARARQ